MTRPAGHPELRQRVIAALADLLTDPAHHHTTIGSLVGIQGTTVSRRGADLAAWPLLHVLQLAIELPAPELASAISAYLEGEGGEARPATAVPDSFAAIRQMLDLSQSLSRAVEDQRIDQAEARDLVAVSSAAITELTRLNVTMRAIAERAS